MFGRKFTCSATLWLRVKSRDDFDAINEKINLLEWRFGAGAVNGVARDTFFNPDGVSVVEDFYTCRSLEKARKIFDVWVRLVESQTEAVIVGKRFGTTETGYEIDEAMNERSA